MACPLLRKGGHNKTAATSLATWHVRIPFKIIIELSVRRSDHQEIAGDLEGARVPPGSGGLIDVDVQSGNIGIHSAWRKANGSGTR